MFKRIRLLITLLVAVIAMAVYFSMPIFAEGDTVCKGRILGSTAVGNVNTGHINFDAHPAGPEGGGQSVDLSIVGLGNGFAPGSRGNAACIENEIDTFEGVDYEYALRGWAWNTNLGFVSFSCENGTNNAGDGLGVACGNVDYGVYVSSPAGGIKLLGYAWSPNFGWIQFKGSGNQGGVPFDYEVAVDDQGVLNGYAWSEANVWLNFSGVKLVFPEDVVPGIDDPVDPDTWCEEKPFLCFNVDKYPPDLEYTDPDEYALGFGAAFDNSVKVADGVDGYEIHMYLRDATGLNPMDPNLFSNFDDWTDSITLSWIDTVKRDQTSKTVDDFSAKKNPWTQDDDGAVVFKPLKFADFSLVEPGHYVSNTVASYAPTTVGNLSFTTSTTPSFTFKNQQFLHDLGLDEPDDNKLIFQNISYTDLKDLGGETVLPSDVIYPNGRIGMELNFRPAVEISTLYANDRQDKILAYRSIPMNFKINGEILGALPAEVTNAANVNFYLKYDTAETCLNNPDKSCQFEFDFVAAPPATFTIGEQGDTLSTTGGNINNADTDVQAVASVPVVEEGQEPADFAEAPSLYSKIDYLVDGKKIAYYGNKLPRLPGDDIANFVVVIHGTVHSQAIGNVQKDAQTQSSGNVNVNIIRDTINENLEKFLGSVGNLSGDPCTITALGANETVPNCSENVDYKKFVVGDENVLYFDESEVTLDLDSGGSWTNEWVIISNRGSIFVDSNLYNAVDNGQKLSLIAFRSSDENYFETGHVYIAPCTSDVKNVQATMIADGSVFSYSGDHADIDQAVPGAGEPIWESYVSMIDALSCQMLIEGVIFSDNTIGGSSLDQGSNHKNYLLIGGGEVLDLPATLESRMRAQYYDYNNLRMFRLNIETTPEGLPIDQKCGKGLTLEDVLKINNNETVCGEFPDCDPNGDYWQDSACDGVNPFKQFEGPGGSGDLVAPKDPNILADGLDNSKDFDPLYIFYRAPSEDSFVFSKAGSLNIGN